MREQLRAAFSEGYRLGQTDQSFGVHDVEEAWQGSDALDALVSETPRGTCATCRYGDAMNADGSVFYCYATREHGALGYERAPTHNLPIRQPYGCSWWLEPVDLVVAEEEQTRVPTIEEVAGCIGDVTGGLSLSEYMERLRDD